MYEGGDWAFRFEQDRIFFVLSSTGTRLKQINRSIKGKTIVATGATSGIGEAAVLALAGQGARIVFVARDEARVQATIRKLEAKAPGLGHRMHLADLSSMAETRKVGAAIAASEPRSTC